MKSESWTARAELFVSREDGEGFQGFVRLDASFFATRMPPNSDGQRNQMTFTA